MRGAATQARAFTLDAVLPCYLYTAITFSETSSKFVVKIKKKNILSRFYISTEECENETIVRKYTIAIFLAGPERG